MGFSNYKILPAAVLALMGLLSLPSNDALADAMNDRPVSIHTSRETSLQRIFNRMTRSGPRINVGTGQSNAALFGNSGNTAVGSMVVEMAGYRGTNSFGLYSRSDPTRRVRIFSGPDGRGDTAEILFMADGSVSVGGVNYPDFGTEFGFYIDVAVTGDVFFTEDSLNGGDPQALVFQGNGETVLDLPGLGEQVFGEDDFIIAFEDLAYENSDLDYQDLVVMISGIRTLADQMIPAPEPATLLLFGIGCLGAGVASRRRRRKTGTL